MVSVYAEYWRQSGSEVFYLFGTSQFVPADLILVHVDLSVVPQEYLEFAKRYPIHVNANVADIRKSNYSTAIIRQGENYDGKVIVKSNWNYAGRPESKRLGVKHNYSYKYPQDYEIFENLSLVPTSYRMSSELIVEKFVPEIDDGLFCIRNYHFVGKHAVCFRMKAEHPIVSAGNYKGFEVIEPHPYILEMRRKLDIDYGKIDFVVTDGIATMFDVNKTTGKGGAAPDPNFAPHRKYRADGINTFFE